MKILVTGGAGFIGSNMVHDLVRDGLEVVVVDNLTTGSLENITDLEDKIKFINSSCADVLDLSELHDLDGIYHYGIPSTTELYRNDHFLVGNAINEFISVLELARREKCRLIYASSSSVYNGNKPPFNEEMEVPVKDFYTEARFAMERMARLYNDFYGVSSIGFRFFSVYGPREEAKKHFANLISQFLWDMKKGISPIIYGDGKQTRDFTFVDDINRGFRLGMSSSLECEVINLGTGKFYDLNQLVAILNRILNTNIKAVYKENPLKNYVYETQADTTKAKNTLDFEAKISLEEGIGKIV